MKKRIISLFCALVITLSLTAPAFAYTGEEQYKNLNDIIEYIKQNGLNSSKDDDPLKRALIALFEKNPTAYDAIMSNMLSSYDRYSGYVPAGSYQQYYPSNSDYVGIGVTLEEDAGRVRIAEVASGGSAEKAGILVGDIIEMIGGTSAVGMNIAASSPLLRGEEGTKVSVSVNRNGKIMTFVLERKKISIPNFQSYKVEDGIYYMKLSRFAENSTYLQFMVAMREMMEQETKSLIFDLRGNPGGELNMALNMLNRLIPDKDQKFFSIAYRENGTKKLETYSADGIGPQLNKIIILSDNNSASASEIVQSSLCDLGYAVSVGETTYGKGRGQQHLMFDDGSAVVLTSIELLPPGSGDYDGVGLKPTYEVKNTLKLHPAASCEKVPERFLNITNVSEETGKLNSALKSIGFLKLDEKDDPNEFSNKTRDALNEFRAYYGVAPQTYLDAATAKLINQRLADYKNQQVLNDAQMQKALELAREYAKQPVQYTLDKNGNYINNNSETTQKAG